MDILADICAQSNAVETSAGLHYAGRKPRGSLRELEAILREVAEVHGISSDDLKGPTKPRRIAHPRQEFMAKAHATGRFSTNRIGQFLGGRDHSTVVLGIRRHNERVEAQK